MKWLRTYGAYLLLALLIGINLAAWANREQIADWWQLRGYQPTAEIAALAADVTMTGRGRHLFYINNPSLENKENFNRHCSDHNEETAVLGCYHGDRQGIFIYAVTDKRLAGVRQVTAAHEMLHQAYNRLGGKERERISTLLKNFYSDININGELKSKVDSYKGQPGVDIVNEMHSIFGSEVRNLPPALENYYRQYFTDRGKVVSFSESYRAEFTRRKELVKFYDRQLADLKQRIENNKATLEDKMSFLKEKEKTIDQDIANSDQAAYNADVQAYNLTVKSYNSLLDITQELISQYNELVGKRNELAVQERELQQALDSRLDAPVSQQ